MKPTPADALSRLPGRAWEAVASDFRASIRGLLRSWDFTLATSALLALAIGATAAIFAIVNAVLLQPLPYPDAERIVSVETFWTQTGRASQDVAGADFTDWQAQGEVFERLAFHIGEVDVATVVGGRAEFANDMYVSPEFFDVFGQSPSAGRLLNVEDVPAADADPTVVVVRHGWAEAHYGSAEAAVGQIIVVYNMPMRIVGVAAPGFSYPGATDLWSPAAGASTDRSQPEFHVVGKLRKEVDLASAREQMRIVGNNLARQYPENQLKTVALVPLRERLTGNVQIMLWLLMGAVIVVLLIACFNVSNLLLARAGVRRREIALRAALGAGRGRLVRQLLTESCLLGLFAGAVGLVLAALFVWALRGWLPADLPRLDEVRLGVPVVLFAFSLSMLSVILFGLLPALHASRLDLSQTLQQGGSKGTVAGGGTGMRAGLVVAEVALSMVLLIGAGLLLRSFHLLQQVDVGFARDRVLVAYTQYPAGSDEQRRARTTFYTELLGRLAEVPGVTAVAGVSFLPMGRERRPARSYAVQGMPEGQPGALPQAEFNAITSGYFDALDIPIRTGRDFRLADTPETPPVAIVNEALARAAFGTDSPLGRQIRISSNAPWMEIVGVVGDVRWQDPDLPPPPVIYAASTQGIGGSLSLIVRSPLEQASVAAALRQLLQEAGPGVPARFESMDELFAGALAYPRFRGQLIGAFAAVAAVLAAIGIFSVLACLVGQRTREIAIRRAVGASAIDVVRMIAGQGLRLIATGLALGLLGALGLGHLLGGLLYGVSPWDAGTYAVAIAVLGGAAMLAMLVPALRASAIPPVLALQQ